MATGATLAPTGTFLFHMAKLPTFKALYLAQIALALALTPDLHLGRPYIYSYWCTVSIL